MRNSKTVIIAVACAAVIGFAINASARGGMGMGNGGWYQQGQGWHHQGDYGSEYNNQMVGNTSTQSDRRIETRNPTPNATSGYERQGSMMGYAPRGGGYCW